ncbi:hypothetical protein Y032_0170g273 [Ancylostoma ceylanicum]|uniref:MULE transposase domain-containing protein n=1 Tax=Ancylostoma ceylanicum TaxID=53326 RepID=A0A016SW94_9BILA|nr:hypothetical protein Y032_0170g273 [Ancylostoma ceylanicum]
MQQIRRCHDEGQREDRHIKKGDETLFGASEFDVQRRRQCNPSLLKWTTSEEEYLKGLLKEFTFDYILKKMRSENDPRLSRLYYINKSDPWNLVVKNRLRPGLKEYSHRGVALDDTFYTTRYNNLRLAALLVADKKDRGLPAGFLLCNNMTSEEVKILFEEAKQIVPDFNPKIFLSDEAMAFFNGFKMVFPGSTASLLFCLSHSPIMDEEGKGISKDELAASYFIMSTVTCDALKKAFSQLLKIADEATFQNRLTEVMSYLSIQGHDSFISYLQWRINEWAGFQRRGLVFNTTMIAERWHGRLKTEYLHRNATARADYLIDMLIKSSNELATPYFIMDRRKLARPFRVRECNAAHRTAV